jgi:tetratricopeptide (TPR) repeat protein
MSAILSRQRRIGVAIVTLGLASVLFRGQVAEALVVRGDDFMSRSALTEAMTRYERARAIDPDNSSAIERVVFAGMEMRTPASLRDATAAANVYLAEHPNDGAILADRALCYLIERRYALALLDFEHAAKVQRDARYYVFAGWAANRMQQRARARRLWKTALAIDGRYVPARMALEHSK